METSSIDIIAKGVEQGCYRVIKRLIALAILLVLGLFVLFVLYACMSIMGG